MKKVKFLADTNALIYIFKNNPCMQPYLKEKLAVSFISKIELFAYKQITKSEEKIIETLLGKCKLFGVDTTIIQETIQIRKKYDNPMSDAIIAATAIVNNLNLLTADKGFSKIKELNIILLQP